MLNKIKEILKKKNKNKTGSVEYLLIFFVIIFGIFLTGIFNNFNDTYSIRHTKYIMKTPTPLVPKSGLQMQSLDFTTPVPTLTGMENHVSTTCMDKPSNSQDLASLINEIKTKYGIVLSGDHSLTVGKANMVFHTMCLLFVSPAYIKNLNSVKTSFTPHPNPVYVQFSYQKDCFAWTNDGLHIELIEPCSDLIDSYVLIHELTHIMQKGVNLGRDAHWNEWQYIWTQEKNHRIPTGPCIIEEPGNGEECQADAVAEFVYYKEYRNTWNGSPPAEKWTFNPPNYPTEWPLWYNFVQSKIFGFPVGYDFYHP